MERGAIMSGPLASTIVKLGHEVPRCQRVLQNGRQCAKAAAGGRPFCRTHRGNIVRIGPANPAWNGGQFSRLLPQSMRASSRPVLNHRDTIEVFDGRIEAKLREVAAGSVAQGSELRDTFARLMTAMQTADSDGIRTALNDLRELIDARATSEWEFRALDALFRQRAALVDAERRFMLDARNAMTREEAGATAAALVAAITKRVTDPKVLNAIMEDVRRVIDIPPAE
jgi:hypothetical protein